MIDVEIQVPGEILSSESVLFLYTQTQDISSCKSLLKNLEKIEKDKTLTSKLSGNLKKSAPLISLATQFKLCLPNAGENTRDSDKENALRTYTALQNLTPAMARDERLWVTLALANFEQYVCRRWKLESTDIKIRENVRNHIFMNSARDAWRDQAFARLWWTGYYAHKMSGELSLEQILALLYHNSELANSFLGRPGLVNEGTLAKAILKVVHENYIQSKRFNWDRTSFQRFMKSLDLQAGSLELAAINRAELLSKIDACFAKSHQ